MLRVTTSRKAFISLCLTFATIALLGCDEGISKHDPAVAKVESSSQHIVPLAPPVSTSAGDSEEPMIPVGPESTIPCPGCMPPSSTPIDIPFSPDLLPPSADATVLFADTFSVDDSQNYKFIDLAAGPLSIPSSWVISGGVLKQAGTASGNYDANETSGIAGDSNWSDYSVEMYGYSRNTPIGIVARYSKNGFYLFSLRSDDSSPTDGQKPVWLLQRYDLDANNFATVTKIGGGSLPSSFLNRWVHFKLAVFGSTLTAYADGSTLGNVKDTTYKSGGAGAFAEASGVSFDNMRVLNKLRFG